MKKILVLGLSPCLMLLVSFASFPAEFSRKGASVDHSQGFEKPVPIALAFKNKALSPQIKKDRMGRLWMIWEEWSRSQSTISLGIVEGGQIMAPRSPTQPQGFNYSPDICFDQTNRPFLTWVNVRKSSHGVYVQELESGRTWLLDSCLSPSTFTPRIIADSQNQIWVFWTRRDRSQEEIFYCVSNRSQWSSLQKMRTNPGYPSVNPTAALSEGSVLWLAWSGYTGRNYAIYVSQREGNLWSKPERISDGGNNVNNLFPCIGFASGGVPVIAWLSCSEKRNTITLKYLKNGIWSEGQQVSGPMDGLAIPKMMIEGEKVEIFWQDQEGAKETSFFLGQKGWDGFLPLPLPTSQIISNPTLSEDEYTCFGDSITYGYLNHERFPEKGYVPRLEVLLNENFGESKCDNLGWPSEITSRGLARIEGVLSAYPSRCILIMEGTNDVVFNNISMDTAVFNLKEMAQRCLDYGAFPALATIIPRRDNVWNSEYYRERIYYLNEQIRQVTAELAIPLVEQFNTFNDYPETDGGVLSLLSEDLKHPSEKGYQLMAQTWFEGIQKFPFPPVDIEINRRDFFINPPFDPIKIFSIAADEGRFNDIVWKDNPKISDKSLIKGYNIYRKKAGEGDGQFRLVHFNSGQLEYRDENIVPSETYVYMISGVRTDGVEGPCSSPVADH